jgi:5-methylcytosine-specific restriction endonuclease McrA
MRMRQSRLRVLGNARGLMMLCRDVRRRWMQYGENRNVPDLLCAHCGLKRKLQKDHIYPIGKRPQSFYDLGDYAYRMFNGECQGLCGPCNRKKGAKYVG